MRDYDCKRERECACGSLHYVMRSGHCYYFLFIWSNQYYNTKNYKGTDSFPSFPTSQGHSFWVITFTFHMLNYPLLHWILMSLTCSSCSVREAPPGGPATTSGSAARHCFSVCNNVAMALRAGTIRRSLFTRTWSCKCDFLGYYSETSLRQFCIAQENMTSLWLTIH